MVIFIPGSTTTNASSVAANVSYMPKTARWVQTNVRWSHAYSASKALSMASVVLVGVSLRWLMNCIVARFAALPAHLHVRPVVTPWDVRIGRLEVEADELWSVVAKKAHKPWVWLAMDTQTRHIIAFHVGDCRHERARQVLAHLPAVYREQATACA